MGGPCHHLAWPTTGILLTKRFQIARWTNPAGVRGAVDLLYDVLGKTRSSVAEVGTGSPQKAVDIAKRAGGAGCIVFTQTEGSLSRGYAEWATEVLQAGACVLELNTFALPSKWRPDHERYRMLVASRDGLLRYRLRSLAFPGTYVSRAAVVAYPLMKPISRSSETARHQLTQDPHALVLLRVGRPDPRKWTSFEFEFAKQVALSDPNRQIVLVLIGVPECVGTRHDLPNLNVRRLPTVVDVGEEYGGADVYVHCSRIGETFGMTLYEAAVAGLKIVLALDLGWDCAPLEYLDLSHEFGSRKALLARAGAGGLHWHPPPPPLLPKTPLAYIDELVSIADPSSDSGTTPVPSVRDALTYLAALAAHLDLPTHAVVTAIGREVARGVKRRVEIG